MKQQRVALVTRRQKRVYTGFVAAIIALFVLTTWYTDFHVINLIKNGDAFWAFITEDFLPPALPKASKVPNIISSVIVPMCRAQQQ